MPDPLLFDKIDLSVRSKDAQNRVIMVMNPATKAHWIYKRFFESRDLQGGENTTIEDTTYIHTSYKDNEKHLDATFLANVRENERERGLRNIRLRFSEVGVLSQKVLFSLIGR